MKRCQQCNFVYEDDQCQCDLDGGELVDALTTELPSPLRATTQPEELPVSSRGKHFIALSLVVAAVLGTVFVLAYNSLTNRKALENALAPSVIATANSEPLPNQEPALPAPEPTPNPTQPPATDVKAVKRVAPLVTRTPVVIRTPALTSAPAPIRTPTPAPIPQGKKPQPLSSPTPPPINQRKDSGVGSMLKKAARILKKPFKF